MSRRSSPDWTEAFGDPRIDLLVQCVGDVGLNGPEVKLGKGNCLEGGKHEAQDLHAEFLYILGRQSSPEGGRSWCGLCSRLKPATPDDEKAGGVDFGNLIIKV